MEVAAHPVGELLQAEAVGRQQQAADAQAVDVRADGAAVDAVGQRAALSVQDAQHHREEVGDHPGNDLGNRDNAGRARAPPAVPQNQAERRDAEEEAGEIRVVGRAVVGDPPRHGQRQPVALVFDFTCRIWSDKIPVQLCDFFQLTLGGFKKDKLSHADKSPPAACAIRPACR